MEQATENTGEVAEVSNKTTIRPDITKMVKTATGSYHKDDPVGHALAGLTLPQVKEIAGIVGLDAGKYEHLNNGQQRMNLGNSMRKLVNKPAEGTDPLGDITFAADKMKEDNAAAVAEAAAAKEAAKAAKAETAAVAKPKKEKKAKKAEAEPAEDPTV